MNKLERNLVFIKLLPIKLTDFEFGPGSFKKVCKWLPFFEYYNIFTTKKACNILLMKI